ncbi:MAG TPA: hypothetical protein ENN60_03790 [archaeon]|nr:hypothetical protein [archaeon]
MTTQIGGQLLDKAKEFRREATRCLKDGSLDSAVVLISKTAFAVVDHHLFLKGGFIPSDHQKRKDAVRFRLPEVLPYLSDIYDKYILAYQQRMTRTDVEVVQDALGEILKLVETQI